MDPESYKKWMEEMERMDREAIEHHKLRRNANLPSFPAERIHQFMTELERRCNEAGQADPKIVAELLAELRAGATG
jgi:hypothetical protein